MKQKTIIILLLLAVCCGCYFYSKKESKIPGNISVENDSVENDSVENDSVENSSMEDGFTENNSGQTENPSVAVTFKNSEDTVKHNRLENDYIRLWNEKNNKTDTWMQENLDGTEKKKISFSADDVLWITNDWLYCYDMKKAKREGEEYTIYRIPIKAKKNNEVLFETEKKEVLFRVKLFIKTEFMVTDHYIIYGVFLSETLIGETISYYRFDFGTKESVRLFNLELSKDPLEGTNGYIGIYNEIPSYLPVIFNNAFFVSGRAGLFRVPFDTLVPEIIYSGRTINSIVLPVDDGGFYFSHDTDSLMAVSNDVLCFTATGRELMQYDGDSGKVTCILSEQELRAICKKLKLWDENALYKPHGVIEGFRIRNERLYMNLMGVWDKVPVDNTDFYTAQREVLLSAALSNLTEWKLEDTLAEYILKNASCNYVKENSDKILEEETANTLSRTCYLYDMGDGKILVSCYYRKKSDESEGTKNEVLYDVDTGKIVSLDKDYSLYYQWQWRKEFSPQ